MAHKPLGFMQLAIIVGFSMFYALYLITFFGVFLFFPAGLGFTLQHLGQVVYFAGALVGTELILVHFRKRNASDFAFTPPAVAVLGILGALLPACVIADAAGVPIALPVLYASCAGSGLFASASFMYWDELAKRGYIKRNMLAHSVVFAIGGCTFVACQMVLHPLAIGVLCLALLASSMLLLAFIDSRAEKGADHPIEPAYAFFARTRHIDCTTGILTVAFGFAFILLYHYIGAGLLAVMAFATAADFALTMALGADRVFPFVGVLRICMALVSVALILFAAPFGAAQICALCAVIVIWFLYRTINGGSLMELAASRELSLLYTVGRGKLASNSGFCIGLVVGIATLELAPADTAAVYVALALVAAIVLSALLLLPFENDTDASGIHTLAPVRATVTFAGAGDSLEDKCKRLADRYKLSPREKDVLAYVVKGRNARFAAEKLFITESTAKTHIANIYRKANVHSQQELLDVLDRI